MLTIAAAPGGPAALCVHPSAGAAEPSGLTHDTCIHVPACALCTPIVTMIRVAIAKPMMPRRPFAFVLKRTQF